MINLKSDFGKGITIFLSIVFIVVFTVLYKSHLRKRDKDFFYGEDFRGIIVGKFIDSASKNEDYIGVMNNGKIEDHYILMTSVYDTMNIGDYIIKNRSTHNYFLIRKYDTITFKQ